MKITLLQFLFSGCNLFISIFWQSIQAYSNMRFLSYVSYQVGIFISIILVQLFITLMLILSWFHEYYEIKKGEIVHRKGIFLTKKDVYYLRNIETITLTQGFVDKIFNLGTIELHSSFLKERCYLYSIANPHKYLEILEWAIPEKAKVEFKVDSTDE